jgi:hypothetical protein
LWREPSCERRCVCILWRSFESKNAAQKKPQAQQRERRRGKPLSPSIRISERIECSKGRGSLQAW